MPSHAVTAATLALVALPFAAAAATPDPTESAFRALYKELVETNTTQSSGSCTQAAEAMRSRLLAAGLPAADATILAPADRPKDGALIAVLHGRDAALKPLLLLAHIDVVEARREDWKRDPFKLTEENGWFYARGAADDKAMAAVFTDALVRMSKEHYVPRRSLKLALTCGEETADTFNSVHWLLTEKPGALDAAFALNEGAGGELDAKGRRVALQVQAGEKIYQDFKLSMTDSGGHSSRPKKTNIISRMGAALGRVGDYRFPIIPNAATRAYFDAQAKLVDAKTAADMRAAIASTPDENAVSRLWDINPSWNGMLRTTCIASMIQGGHAPNAQPQAVTANVNCRILPATPVAEVQATLAKVLADDGISIAPVGEPAIAAPVPPLGADILGPVRAVANTLWPGVAIVPTMSTGATDGRFLNAAGIPTYGISGMFQDAEGSHAHGLDERISVKSLMDGRQFLYALVKRYADAAPAK
ncbi:M20/M25/M40 family metallo-hydrolase [Cognatilysobacter lacus]|uniref:M20/M25/M40 family metallo-hydrolase n=1 Tax=Cognatilysobacter lacus TaxID=1643323 RepID=A0A5D8Z7Q6_9GAMM|nr:M20/M25/M40 family metallo-hydrolase [Lysobacter lacus]TZF90965.1 M20/M25/M40 family metallo-hydrolase [Lysobacter lacus]